MNLKSLSILIKQGDIAYQISEIQNALNKGLKRNTNIDIKDMEPDELINFHWKRIEFLEWLKPLQKEQLQVISQEMQLNISKTDLQIAKAALVSDLLLNIKNEI